jgi:hypothetical protein
VASVLRCQNPGRLQHLRDQSAINAIDYMLVADGTAVPDGLRQRLLLLRFLSPDGLAGLDHDDVEVVGGVRVIDPPTRWVSRLDQLDPTTIDPELTVADQSYLDQLITATTSGDHWLAVMVERYGDHSTYRLRLGTVGSPPPGFDLVLSELDFSFKVACPSPFDCFLDEACGVEPADEPELDYLARDFLSFRQLMFDRLALISPTDRSRDPATLRSTLVEVLAAAADRVAYFQDAAATEAYLDTARTRPSIRRHARLLDYHVHEGCNARAFVQIELASGALIEETVSGGELTERPIAPGARLLTRVAGAGPVIDPNEVAEAVANGAESFEVLVAPAAFSGDNNELAIYTWGDGDCCLPRGATHVTLVCPDDVRLDAGDFLVLEQTRSPTSTLEVDADPTQRHVVRLIDVGDPIVDFLSPGIPVRTVTWHPDDALPFALPVTTADQPVAVARGNLVLVDHGATIEGESLTIEPWGHDRAGRRADLARSTLSWGQPIEGTRSSQTPPATADPDRFPPPVSAALSASALAAQDPRLAQPLIELQGELESWVPRRDLLSTPASAREFVVEMENDGRARLRFGDDVRGRRPAATGRSPALQGGFSATYRSGNGEQGNVGAEAIAHLLADPEHLAPGLAALLVGVRNPVAARGGIAPESIAEVKRYAPESFRVQQRAVTESDWVSRAESHPRVQRAVAQLGWTGSWHTVHITVDPLAGSTFDLLRDDLVRWLEPFRLAGHDLEVLPPSYAALDIALTVCVDDRHYPEDVERILRDEFSTTTLADGRPGFFHPDNFSFGSSVWLSQIIARCMAVDGVHFVDVTNDRHPNRFKRWGSSPTTEIADGRIRIDALEIARCDNDPNAPDNGQIQFFMEGGP